jgi:hypothetical protein
MTFLRVVGEERKLSRRERHFMRECKRLDALVSSAQGELQKGLRHEDVEVTYRASKRLLAVGVLFKDVADVYLSDLGDAS